MVAQKVTLSAASDNALHIAFEVFDPNNNRARASDHCDTPRAAPSKDRR